jgi:hypothetical protein
MGSVDAEMVEQADGIGGVVGDRRRAERTGAAGEAAAVVADQLERFEGVLAAEWPHPVGMNAPWMSRTGVPARRRSYSSSNNATSQRQRPRRQVT